MEPEFDFESYLQCLRRLVEFPTLFTRPAQIEVAMGWCEEFFIRHLKGYRVYRDQDRNLIACPENIDFERDVIYLSAHIDTVGADPQEWDEPFSPFSLYEDEDQVVARGVSDCKAGVAFELFLARLLSRRQISLSNLIFTVTFKEEGAGAKSSCRIGKDLGCTLPVSNKDTFFIVLENNVTVADPSILNFYTAERGNFVIRVSDRINRLRDILSRLPGWNPVCIRPVSGTLGKKSSVQCQQGGHVCSVARDQNLLTRLLQKSLDTDLLWAGDDTSFSVVPSQIFKGKSEDPAVHHLTLSNRSFDTVEDVRGQLVGIVYEEVKDFSISQGMNFDRLFSEHPLSAFIKSYRGNGLHTRQTSNIGVSDATIVTRSMGAEFKKRFYPIVMGPGSRSQRHASPFRLTHGKNETFDKQSGKAAVACLLSVLVKLGSVIPETR